MSTEEGTTHILCKMCKPSGESESTQKKSTQKADGFNAGNVISSLLLSTISRDMLKSNMGQIVKSKLRLKLPMIL